jgi:hypothetical protein
MGLDFIRQCAPAFQRSWDRNRVHLSEPTLFTEFPALRDQTYRAIAKDGFAFQQGQELLVKLEEGLLLVCDRNLVIGTINQPPVDLVDAMTAVNGFALGVVQNVLVEGRAADLSVS